MNGDKLEESLIDMERNERHLLLRINHDDFQKLCNHVPTQSYGRNHCCFWRKRQLPEEKEPLLSINQLNRPQLN